MRAIQNVLDLLLATYDVKEEIKSAHYVRYQRNLCFQARGPIFNH